MQVCASLPRIAHILPFMQAQSLISRNVRIVWSAAVTSWQSVKRNNTAVAPVSFWLHQRRCAQLRINDWPFLSLQTFDTDKPLLNFEHRITKRKVSALSKSNLFDAGLQRRELKAPVLTLKNKQALTSDHAPNLDFQKTAFSDSRQFQPSPVSFLSMG